MKSLSCKLLVGSLMFLVGACTVTSEKIQVWKGTQKGPAKLRAAVRDTKIAPSLRVEAAEALADISLVDILTKDLKTLTAADRGKISNVLAEKLIVRMNGTSEQATTKVQIQAKDVLFSLRPVLSGGARAKVDQALVNWVSGDWIARSGGVHSAEKIVTTIGHGSAPALAARIGVDRKVVLVIARLLNKIGTPKDRQVAAQKLVALANEQNPPQKATFEALGKMRASVSRVYLQKVAKVGKGPYRAWALRALKFDPHPSTVAVAGHIAASTKEGNDTRAAAFEVLEKIAGDPTLAALGRIIAADPKALVRYRAVEAIVVCCGAKGVKQALEALPVKQKYKKGDVSDFIEKDIKRVGKAALPVLRQALTSKSWIARVIAARLLGEWGGKQDLPALRKTAGDRAKLKGWGTSATVGSEAQAALAKLSGGA